MATAELSVQTDHSENGIEESRLSHVIGIGGLLSIKSQWPYYRHLLTGGGSPLHVSKHFLAIPHAGLSPMDEMYGELEENLIETHDK